MDQELDDAFSWLSLTGSNAVLDMFDGNILEVFSSLQHNVRTICHDTVVRLFENAVSSSSLKGRLEGQPG